MSDTEPPSARGGESLKHRLREELRNYLIVSAYLFVCFGVLLFYRSALLQDAGAHHLLLGAAVVKALIVGKFLLIGDAIRARLQRRPGRLLGRIAKRVFWLLLILVLLTIAEELTIGWIHGHSIAETQSEFRARSMLELMAEVLLMGLILVPLVSAAELRQALGPGVLRRLFLRPADSARNAADHDDTHEGGST
jgi:hypothetical protein